MLPKHMKHSFPLVKLITDLLYEPMRKVLIYFISTENNMKLFRESRDYHCKLRQLLHLKVC